MGKSRSFVFDGGAATYVGTAILAFLVTLVTLGFATPYAIVLRQRWRAKHTIVDGRRLVFVGTGISLFGNWLKWFLLIIITLGVYSFWVGPRVTKWVVENTDFEAAVVPSVASNATLPTASRLTGQPRHPRRHAACEECGEVLPSGAQFCGSCGSRVTA